MATLTGNLADVTNKAPENISSITVKAPAARIGGSSGSSVIVTSPATVDFNSSTGNVTISNLTGGLSWLYIEGDGWSDSIALAVADGMTTLVEAVANALGAPGIADYIRLLADLEGRIEDVAQGAVDAAAENIKWTKRELATGEDLDTVITPGLYTVINYTRAVSLVNRPEESNAIDRASLEVQTAEGGVQQTWYPMGVASRTDMPVMRRRRDTGGTWTEWERINAFTPAKESYIMQSILAAKWEKRALVQNEDMNDLTTAGMYYVPSYTVANSLVNNPIELSRSAIDRAKIEVAVTGSYISQIWTTIPSATKAAETVERHRDPTGEWSEWAVYGGGSRDEDKPVTSFETLGLASHGMEGEHVGTRSLLQSLSSEESPVWSWWAPTPTQALEIPTHDGGGQTCHPSVLYFPDTWGGWKYWMAHTPYPNFQEAHEDPNIAVSDDGVNWQVPNGVTNPLDDGLGRPNYHNSDTHLAMWGDTMVLTWRTVDRPNGGQNIIYARTSKNGVTWTPKVEVLKVPLGTNESTFVSQSLVKMPTGWRLYGIRSNYGPNRLGYYETSVETLPKTSDWGAAKDCDLGEIPTGRDPWHSEVQRLAADDWVAVISDGKRGSTGVDGDIYLARSTDGVKWDVSPMPLTPRNNGVINSLYKTGFVVSGTGTNRTFDLWVSGYRTDKRTWGIYRTLAEYRGSNQAETLPVKRVGTGSPEGNVAAPVGSVYTDTAATNGAIRWVKASGTGNTGWRDYADKTYIDAEITDLSNELDERVKQEKISPQQGTAWAHISQTGHRLPLGYTHGGRLDAWAQKIFREDVGNVHEVDGDSRFAHATVTSDDKILLGIRRDGRIVAPGLLHWGAPGDMQVAGDNVAPVWPDMSRIVGWGSSTMQGLGSTLGAVSTGWGSAYVNEAKGGERAGHTAARLGSRPALVSFPGGEMPASGTVNIQVSNLEPSVQMKSYDVKILGVQGRISSTDTLWTFTRADLGDPVVVADDTPAIPIHPHLDAVTILNIGKNSFSHDNPGREAEIIEITDTAYAHLTPITKRVIVLGHFCDVNLWGPSREREQIEMVRQHQKSRYGRQYVDMWEFVTGPEIWEYTGITPTAEDLANQEIGNLPPSVAIDNGHLNSAGYAAVTTLIQERMRSLGWY